MNEFAQELASALPGATEFARAVIRLAAAALFGAVVGFQRERVGKAAGLRTHMLVALGAALVVLAGAEAGMTAGDLSRVVQGTITGIGFLGAGAILKFEDERAIRGLTTAAGIWLTAVVGIAAGLGRLATASLAVVATWIILTVLGRLERRLDRRESAEPPRENESA